MSAISLSSTAAPTAAIPSVQRHLYWIDWIRFLAAAFVLLDHACQFNWDGPAPAGAPTNLTLLDLLACPAHLGRQAVVVFFVLSGALVGGLTLEKFRAGTFDAPTYAADRSARIFVPLLPALLLSAAVLRVFDLPVILRQFAGCLCGLQGVLVNTPRINGPLWSLAYEMWFYLLAGCAAVAAGRKSAAGARCTALAGVVLALVVLCLRLDWINLACWLVGMSGFGLRHRLGGEARPWLTAGGACLMLAGCLGFRQDLLAEIPGLSEVAMHPWIRPLAQLILSVGTLLVIVSVCRSAPGTHAGVWLERAGTRAAALSYTLYLTHYPVTVALRWTFGTLPRVVTWPSLFQMIAWMAAALAVAAVMYWLFERQTPQTRRWLRARFGGGSVRAGTSPADLKIAVEA